MTSNNPHIRGQTVLVKSVTCQTGVKFSHYRYFTPICHVTDFANIFWARMKRFFEFKLCQLLDTYAIHEKKTGVWSTKKKQKKMNIFYTICTKEPDRGDKMRITWLIEFHGEFGWKLEMFQLESSIQIAIDSIKFNFSEFSLKKSFKLRPNHSSPSIKLIETYLVFYFTLFKRFSNLQWPFTVIPCKKINQFFPFPVSLIMHLKM